MRDRKQYKEYLRSNKWKSKRSERILRDKGQCQAIINSKKCKSTHKTEVHHLTYARFGNELMIDLITLCNKHHVAIHKQAA